MDRRKIFIFFSLSFVIILTLMTLGVTRLGIPSAGNLYDSHQKAMDGMPLPSEKIQIGYQSYSSETSLESILENYRTQIDSLKNSLQQVIKENSLLKKQIQNMQRELAARGDSHTSLSNLAKICESMSPNRAARILSRLDTQTVVQLISRMNKQKAARILSFLTPDQAVVISRELSRYN